MESFLICIGLFMAASSLFHFLNPNFVNAKLTNIKNVRLIGTILILVGLWGIALEVRAAKILGLLFLASGAWRAIFPKSSIQFQTKAYPRWMHGILMGIAAIIIFALLSQELRTFLRVD